MSSLDEKPRPLAPGGLAVRFVGGYHWTDGRVDDSPVVVLLHACGARADDLVPLAEMLSVPDAFRFALPAAPLPLLGMWVNHRAWWPLDAGADAGAFTAACDAVDTLLDALAPRAGVPPERVVLGGFSRGGAVACEVALRRRSPLAGLVLLSPPYVRAPAWQALMRERAPLPIFIAHGRQDSIHPLAGAAGLRDDLSGAGHDVSWVESDGGHGVTPLALARTSVFLRAVLEPRS